MEVTKAISKLEKSKEFKAFKKEHQDYYLVHAFITSGMEDWQLGYYSKEKDKVIVFSVGSKIEQAPEEEVLKKKKTIKELKMEQVRLDGDGAMKAALKEKDKTHHGETVSRQIVILQNLDGKPVYNVTLVTGAFNIINIKLSATTGQVLSSTKQSIMSLGKQVK